MGKYDSRSKHYEPFSSVKSHDHIKGRKLNFMVGYESQGNGSFRPWVVSALSRFGRGSFRPGSFRPESIRP